MPAPRPQPQENPPAEDDLIVYVRLSDFTGGEISPLLEGRVDLEKYSSSCKLLQNFLPMAQGGAVRRSGTYYVATLGFDSGGGGGIG